MVDVDIIPKRLASIDSPFLNHGGVSWAGEGKRLESSGCSLVGAQLLGGGMTAHNENVCCLTQRRGPTSWNPCYWTCLLSRSLGFGGSKGPG